MANLDTAAKRAAGMAVTGLALVLPIPDGSNMDSVLQRAHVVATYGANTSIATPLDLTGVLRTVAGHEFDIEEGHEFLIVDGHRYRVVELK